jgi:acetylornithine deacetylase
VITALRELERELNEDPPPPYDDFPHPINLNIGVIRGGDWPSTVAAETVVACRLALFPGEDPGDLQRRVEDAVAGADLGETGFSAEVRYAGFRCEGYTLDDESEVIAAVQDAQQLVTGKEAVTYASTATTDARSYQLYGETPALCFGPHAENIHAIDERVLLPSVLQTAQALAVFICDWCGVIEEPERAS